MSDAEVSVVEVSGGLSGGVAGFRSEGGRRRWEMRGDGGIYAWSGVLHSHLSLVLWLHYASMIDRG